MCSSDLQFQRSIKKSINAMDVIENAKIPYTDVAAWCRERHGQVMVCENDGATWLPFRHFADIASNPGRHGGKVSSEAIWEHNTP